MLLNRSFRYWSLLPALLLFAALTLYPLLNLVRMSVSTVAFANGAETWTFTPLRNFAALLEDDVVRPAVVNTLVFVGVSVAIGSMWKLMYNYDFGIFNQAFVALGAMPVNWLGSTSVALWSVIAVDVWHWVPFVFLILFAAVEGISPDLFEAAHVDGATRRQTLRFVVLPLLRPAIVVAFLFRAILAFKVFDEVFLLTAGGPGTSTELVNLHLYKVFFEQNRLGYGAVLSLAVIAAIVAFLLVSRRVALAVASQK